MKTYFFVGLLLYTYSGIAQTYPPLNLETNLSDTISNTFVISCPEKTENRILKSRGTKIEVRDFTISVNKGELKVKSLNTRGNNTLKFRRKSFSISLEEPWEYSTHTLTKIAVNNLSMDRNYWRNRFSFILMGELGLFPLTNFFAEVKLNGKTLGELGLFPLTNFFAEVKLNGKTLGAYLVVQKPDDYAKKVDSPLLIRSQYSGGYEIDYMNGKNQSLIKLLNSKERMGKKLSGKILFDSLNQIVNMERYFGWLAFNFLIMNGDYTDELFYYFDPGTKSFEIIPWDYDDIFASQPHESWQNRNLRLNQKLIFSSESDFDVMIDHDNYLYQKYLEVFSSIIDSLTIEILKNSFEQVYQELFPFYSNEEIIEQSRDDLAGLTNLTILKKDLMQHYVLLLNRLESLKDLVASELQDVRK